MKHDGDWKVGDKAKTTFNKFEYVVCHVNDFGDVWFSQIQGIKREARAQRLRLEHMIKLMRNSGIMRSSGK